MITVRSNFQQLRASLRGLKRGQIRKAQAAAMKSAIGKTRTQSVRDVAAHYGLKQKGIRPGFKSAAHDLRTRLTARGRMIPLTELQRKPKQIRKGIKARISGQWTTVRSAFLAKMKSGHEGAFIRRGKKRLPINELLLPSIAHTLLKPSVLDRVRRFYRQTVAADLKRNIDKALAKAARRTRRR